MFQNQSTFHVIQWKNNVDEIKLLNFAFIDENKHEIGAFLIMT